MQPATNSLIIYLASPTYPAKWYVYNALTRHRNKRAINEQCMQQHGLRASTLQARRHHTEPRRHRKKQQFCMIDRRSLTRRPRDDSKVDTDRNHLENVPGMLIQGDPPC